MVLAGVEKKPQASLGGAGAHERQLAGGQQIGSGASDSPAHTIEVVEVVEAPLEVVSIAGGSQVQVLRRDLNFSIEPGQSFGGSGTLIRDRPENIVKGLTQFDGALQGIAGAGWGGGTQPEETVDVFGFEQGGIFAEALEIGIVLQQFLGMLGVAIVERVHEVEGGVARNQIELGQAARFRFCFRHIAQESFPAGKNLHFNSLLLFSLATLRSHYDHITYKMCLTS